MKTKLSWVWILAMVLPMLVLSRITLGAPVEKPIVAVDVTAVIGDLQQIDTHRFFADKIDKETGGKLLIKRVDPTVFGGFKQATEAMMMGSLQMSHMPNANAAVHATGLMIYDMPFLFKDWDHMMKFANSPDGKAIEQELEAKAGLKTLFYYEDGPRAIFNRLRPVKAPQDLAGMKIRVMENPVYLDTILTFGGNPTPMSVTEVYLSLKQGVIDGVDIAPYAFLVWKLQETAKYCSYTNHVNPPAFMSVNAAWFNGLSKELQDVVRKVSKEAADYHHQRWTADRAKVDKIMRDSGVKIDEIDTAPFEANVRHIWQKYADKIGGWQRIQDALNLR